MNIDLLKTKSAMIAQLVKEVALEVSDGGDDWANLSEIIGMSSSYIADMFAEIDWQKEVNGLQLQKLKGCFVYSFADHLDYQAAFCAAELQPIGYADSMESADPILSAAVEVCKLACVSLAPVYLSNGEAFGLVDILAKIAEKRGAQS